jgi:hypothetical protein
MEILSDRISVVRKDDLTSIVISSVASKKKNKFIAALLVLWIIGGGIMVYSFSSLDAGKTKIVVIIWFAFWLYFFYVLFRLWRWKQYGHEVIKISNGTLKYKKDVKGRGWVNDYKLERIQKLRESQTEAPGWVKNFGGDFWNTDCDSIRFNYEDREIALGYQLEAKERDKLLAVLGEFAPLDEKVSKRSQKTNPKIGN